MKNLRKFVAVLLTVLLLSTMTLPIMSFAYENVDSNDHTSFEDFWAEMTDDEGNVDWTKLPKVLFKAFVTIRFVEVIVGFFREIFGLKKADPAPVQPAEEPVSVAIAA